MPRRVKELRDYPAYYWDILIRIKGGEASVQLPANSSGAAQSMMHDWNRFKRSMMREGHPDAEFAYEIMARREQPERGWIVEYTVRTWYNLAKELKGQKPVDGFGKPLGPNSGADGLPVFPDPQPIPEEADDIVKRLYGLDKLPGDVKDEENDK